MIDFELIGQTTDKTVDSPLFGVWVLFTVFAIGVVGVGGFLLPASQGGITGRKAVIGFSSVMLIVITTGALVTYLIKPLTVTYPTIAAVAASQESYDRVVEAVTDDYDVEVTSPSDCHSEPAEIPEGVTTKVLKEYGEEEVQEHYNRVRFLEKVVAPDSASNPQLLLTTPDGTVTCYTVRYDQSTSTATLLSSSGNVDAPAPESLKKD